MGAPDRKVLTECELDHMQIATGSPEPIILGCPNHPADGVTALYSGTPIAAIRLLCRGCGFEVAAVKVGEA